MEATFPGLEIQGFYAFRRSFSTNFVGGTGFPYFSENVIRPTVHPLLEKQSPRTYPVILSLTFVATLLNDFSYSSLRIKLGQMSNL